MPNGIPGGVVIAVGDLRERCAARSVRGAAISAEQLAAEKDIFAVGAGKDLIRSRVVGGAAT